MAYPWEEDERQKLFVTFINMDLKHFELQVTDITWLDSIHPMCIDTVLLMYRYNAFNVALAKGSQGILSTSMMPDHWCV